MRNGPKAIIEEREADKIADEWADSFIQGEAATGADEENWRSTNLSWLIEERAKYWRNNFLSGRAPETPAEKIWRAENLDDLSTEKKIIDCIRSAKINKSIVDMIIAAWQRIEEELRNSYGSLPQIRDASLGNAPNRFAVCNVHGGRFEQSNARR